MKSCRCFCFRGLKTAVTRKVESKMPIRIPDTLPAFETLVHEGVRVMTETVAIRQDIRPLQIGLLNLMPNKIKTEVQFARLIGASPLQVELTLVRVGGHKAKNTPEEHLLSFYQTWDEVKERKFDGFIITGAPVETLPFEEVTYWPELQEILDWTETNVHSTMNVCWGGMAAIYHSPKLGPTPVGKSGLTLIGYTPEGYQHRVVWFRHVRV